MINLWEIERRRRLSTTAITGLDAVVVSPDGHILAGSVEQVVYLWDLPTLKQSRTILRGNAGSVVSLAFSPDGKTLAAGSNEGSVKLWNTGTWKEVTTFIAILASLLLPALTRAKDRAQLTLDLNNVKQV